jgi:hypothetical protein
MDSCGFGFQPGLGKKIVVKNEVVVKKTVRMMTVLLFKTSQL